MIIKAGPFEIYFSNHEIDSKYSGITNSSGKCISYRVKEISVYIEETSEINCLTGR